MTEQFSKHFTSTFADLLHKPLLLAISGGVDSVVLLQLLLDLQIKPALAHVNFGLRGADSDGDAAFIEQLATRHSLDFFVKKMDAAAYSKINKLSVQESARNLRYDWFNELLITKNYQAIVTAHHADDCLETFIINISRGSGLEGLLGIPERNGYVVRPLLPFTKTVIHDFAKSRNLLWREDASNEKNDYFRNAIRNKIVPAIKALDHTFVSSLVSTQKYLKQAHAMVADAAHLRAAEILIEKDNKLHININPLLKLPDYRGYLYYWLKDYNFSAWEDIYALPFSASGKIIYSKKYALLKDRETLILAPATSCSNQYFPVDEQGYNESGLSLQIENAKEVYPVGRSCVFVDADLLKFPLNLRKWQQGDMFYPFGLKGRKLLSKYFKDEKFSFFEKQETWLLCSGDQIVWVVGKRADDRFKITSDTQRILKISCL